MEKNKQKVFVMGDKHGAAKAMQQCFERSGFDFEKDLLIDLGDICDGWGETYECVELLMKCKNLIAIRGNHDWWWMEYIHGGIHPTQFKHGALATLKSYGFNCLGKEWEKFQLRWDTQTQEVVTNFNVGNIPESHKKFFKYQHRYYLDENKRLFVHGGINRHIPINEQTDQILYWDRDLWYSVVGASTMVSSNYKKIKTNGAYKEIYIGHTATVNWTEDNEPFDGGIHHITTPMNRFNIWNMDTGAGFVGKLTIMDIDTKEYWQSDFCKDLYPDEKGRT